MHVFFVWAELEKEIASAQRLFDNQIVTQIKLNSRKTPIEDYFEKIDSQDKYNDHKKRAGALLAVPKHKTVLYNLIWYSRLNFGL